MIFSVRRREAEMARTISIGNQSFEEIREKGVFSGRQDQFDQRVVGVGRQCDVNYASASFWKDHKYGHAELLLFESLSGQRRFV